MSNSTINFEDRPIYMAILRDVNSRLRHMRACGRHGLVSQVDELWTEALGVLDGAYTVTIYTHCHYRWFFTRTRGMINEVWHESRKEAFDFQSEQKKMVWDEI